MITLPNPDFQCEHEQAEETISIEDALKVFRVSFPRTQSKQKNDLFERAFKIAFTKLRKPEPLARQQELKKRKFLEIEDEEG